MVMLPTGFDVTGACAAPSAPLQSSQSLKKPIDFCERSGRVLSLVPFDGKSCEWDCVININVFAECDLIR